MAADGQEFVSVGEPIPRLRSVGIDKARTINVVWEDGASATIDLAPHISRNKALKPLEDDAVFDNVMLEERGRAIFWPQNPECAIPTTTIEHLQIMAMAQYLEPE
jgi:hypothetical protein